VGNKLKLSFLKYFFAFLVIVPKQTKANNELAQLKKLHTQLNYDKTINDSLKTYKQIIHFFSQSNLDSSIFYFKKAYPLTKRTTEPILTANIYEVIANSYWYFSDFNNAMDFYLRELRIGDSLNNKNIIADSKYNIGWIKCFQLKQYKAVNYFYEALQLFAVKKDSVHLVQLYQGLGNYYKYFKDKYKNSNDSCLKYLLKCVSIFNGASFQTKASGSYFNLAEYYSFIKEYTKAKENSLKGLILAQQDNDEYNTVYNATLLGESYMNLDSLAQAKKIINTITDKLSSKLYENMRLNVYYVYLNIYKKEKNFEKAFEYSMKYKDLSDSINEKTFNENLLQKESDYKLEKKDKELGELQLKNQLQNQKNKQNTYIILGLIIFGILILIILYFLFKSNKQKQQTNILLSSQNEIIKEKNKEIQQSMKYASRIQHALMPTQKYISSNLNRLKKK